MGAADVQQVLVQEVLPLVLLLLPPSLCEGPPLLPP